MYLLFYFDLHRSFESRDIENQQLFILVFKICLLWLSFHFSRGQNRKSRSTAFLCSETKRKCLLRRVPKFYGSQPWIWCIRKRSSTKFGMPVPQKETPGSVNVLNGKRPLAAFLSSENSLLFTRKLTHFHLCDCALGFSLVLRERFKTSRNWAIWK